VSGSPFDYAIVRIVPRVEREEFVNAGVVLHAPTRRFLSCAIGDAGVIARANALAPFDVAAVTEQLDAFRAICAGERDAGPIAQLPGADRFHWLVAPRSTIVQTSPVHGGVCDDPADALRRLFARLVEAP
jgi:hypothetical protein